MIKRLTLALLLTFKSCSVSKGLTDVRYNINVVDGALSNIALSLNATFSLTELSSELHMLRRAYR